MNRHSVRMLSAILAVLVAGCGNQTPEGQPPGVDLNASQTSVVTSAPDPPKAAKTANRGDLHRQGPSMKME